VARIWGLARLLQAGALLLALPLAAQVKLGETTNSANGTISTGYSATSGNMTESTHGWTVGGTATLAGSYYSPNFLSYNISPYLNQSRANSNFQSISDASGVNASTNIFAGSRFPGSVNYSYAYNAEGNYAVPGLADFVTRGNSQNFGVNWSANVPDKPTFTAGYQTGGGDYSVYGTNDQGKNSFHSFNLNSGYRWAGFNLGAYYTNGAGHSEIPQIIAGLLTNTSSDSDALGFTAAHALPMRGSTSFGYNRSTWDTDYLGYRSSGTINLVNTVAAVHPKQNVSLSANLNYSDNLAGQLIQSVIGAGGVVPGFSSNQSSSSLDMMGLATYTPMPNLQTSAFVERRSQSFLGESFGLNSYGGSVGYSRPLLEGSFNGSFSMTANSADNTGEDTLGFSTNENYSTEFRGWHMTGSFGYAQNVQTLLITYMNSYYNYAGNVHRNWGLFNIGMGGGAAHTALTNQEGASSSSQGYNASIGYGQWIMTTGTYSKASGQALATGSGFVPVPVPPPSLPPGVVSLFGGDSYGFSLASAPVKKLLISASYSKSVNSTTGLVLTSSNANNEFTSLLRYRYRKLDFTSGYSRLEQGFSLSGIKPEIISSYYMGISRWFNFF
jgi:hypothetical protein